MIDVIPFLRIWLASRIRGNVTFTFRKYSLFDLLSFSERVRSVLINDKNINNNHFLDPTLSLMQALTTWSQEYASLK